MPVNGSFRRGTDIAKALAMGANAVGVGRPYLWGLGAFGEPGVAKVLEILRTETRVAMMHAVWSAVGEGADAGVCEEGLKECAPVLNSGRSGRALVSVIGNCTATSLLGLIRRGRLK